MKRLTTGVAILLALAVAGCGSAKSAVPARPSATPTLAPSSAAGTRQVADMLGRPITVPDEVTKVVAISPSAVEFANALGLTVVGRVSDSTASDAPTVGSSLSPDFPKIASLAPDLVIADATYQGSRLRDFASFPYPAFILKVGTYDDVIAAFTALGAATNRADAAKTAVDGIQARVDAAVAKSQSAAKPPSVLVVTGAGREVYGGSDATYTGSLLVKLGATNVLGTLPAGAPIAGFGTVDINQLASKNPDAVMAIPSGAGTLAQDITSSPAWANTAAVKNGRVYQLDATLFLRSPGPRVAEAIEKLAVLLYP